MAPRPVLTEVQRRLIYNTNDPNNIQVLGKIEPGETKEGCCFVCCAAPKYLPCLMSCPFFGYPEYVKKEREAAKNIVIRENGVEWNHPSIIMKEGICCGVSPCLFRIEDDQQLVMFDDPMMNSIKNETPCCCNGLIQTCYGGEGETVAFAQTMCGGLFVRVVCPMSNNICCIPFSCAPICLASKWPFARYKQMYVKDASEAIPRIKKARNEARARLGMD
jgi:hypothetical protein